MQKRGLKLEMKIYDFEFSDIKSKIESALRILLKNDLFLLEADVSEWAICHKFAEYLQNQFMGWHVDFDYNRDKYAIKEWREGMIRPDIIVHIRNTDNNLLIIQAKKSNNLKWIDENKKQLKWFTSQKKKYTYQFGALVVFFVEREFQKLPDVTYYQNGDIL
jgi:hypothetical protein